jgi:choline-glycine betaine transporter
MKIIVIVLMMFSFLHSADIEKKDLKLENKKLIEKINKLEKIVSEQEKLLKSKESICKNKLNDGNEHSVENDFPKLMMKKEYQ